MAGFCIRGILVVNGLDMLPFVVITSFTLLFGKVLGRPNNNFSLFLVTDRKKWPVVLLDVSLPFPKRLSHKGPCHQPCQVTRFPHSLRFGRSSLKSQIGLHGHKKVKHARNMLKYLLSGGRINIWICIWLWILPKKTRLKCPKNLC